MSTCSHVGHPWGPFYHPSWNFSCNIALKPLWPSRIHNQPHISWVWPSYPSELRTFPCKVANPEHSNSTTAFFQDFKGNFRWAILFSDIPKKLTCCSGNTRSSHIHCRHHFCWNKPYFPNSKLNILKLVVLNLGGVLGLSNPPLLLEPRSCSYGDGGKKLSGAKLTNQWVEKTRESDNFWKRSARGKRKLYPPGELPPCRAHTSQSSRPLAPCPNNG